MSVNGISSGTTWPFSSSMYTQQAQNSHRQFMSNIMNQLSDEEKKAAQLVQNSLSTPQKASFQQGLRSLEQQTRTGQVSQEEAATRYVDLLEQAASSRERPNIMTATKIDLFA